MKKQILIILTLLIGFTSMAYGQSITVRGTVTDSRGEPLIGAAILLKGDATIGTITDIDGKFILKVPNSTTTLVISSIGYSTKEVLVAKRNLINVVLKNNAKFLNSAVVVGYGKQAKISVTGAISSVTTSDIKRSPTSNISNSLSGVLPGVMTIQSSGQPGRDVSAIYLRGQGSLNNNSPLILVDGIERDINSLDPNEIKSISVLKDASATAVFGVRGANGVILVTTKTGTNEKPSLNVTAEYGFQTFTKSLHTMDSWDYATLRNEALINDGKVAKYSSRQIKLMKEGTNPLYPNTDWLGMIFKQYAPQSRCNVNFSGGNKKVNYFVNAGILMQDGMLSTEPKSKLGYDAGTSMKRYNFRTNFDIKVTNKLKVGVKLAGYVSSVNAPLYSTIYKSLSTDFNANSWNGSMSTTSLYPLFRDAYSTIPTIPGPFLGELADKSNGTYPDTVTGECYGNVNERGYYTEDSAKLNSSFNLSWNLSSITKGLSVDGMISYDANHISALKGARNYNSAIFEVWEQTNQLTNEIEDLYSITPKEAYMYQKMHYQKISKANAYKLNVQARLDYKRTFNSKHHVSGLLLAQRDDKNSTNNLDYNRIGYAGRATYRYGDKYMAEINAGYNGSEQFAKGHRYGFFPATSVGWVVSNENFMKRFRWISNLKFRFSYGKVGSDKLGSKRFLYLDNIQLSNGGSIPTLAEGKTIKENLLKNQDLTWETAIKQNYGLDVGLFQDKLKINIDVFFQDRRDILITRNTMPLYFGYNESELPLQNAGRMKNHGIEFNAVYKKRFNQDFNMSFRATFAYTKNKVVFCDEVSLGDDYVYPYRQQGYKKGQIYGYKIDWNSPGHGYFLSQDEIDNYAEYNGTQPRIGDFVYKDMSGDGKISEADQVQIGYPSVPQLNYSLIWNVQYKNFDLYAMFLGVGMSSNYYNSFGVMEANADDGAYSNIHKDAFTIEKFNKGEKINYPALTTYKTGSSLTRNDFYIQNRSYIRLKNVELGYTLPKKVSKKIKMNKLRIYVNANNLFTWDKLPFNLDPEASKTYDFPLNRVINCGVNITF